VVSLISRNFDLKNFSTNCNFRGCTRLPTKEAIISEFDPKTSHKRDLVSLYFCAEHYNSTIQNVIEEVKRISDGKIVDKRVFEIGYVTH
jgi:hypothetical protein